MADSIVHVLKSTWISHQMLAQPWLWPICETLHFIGLSMLFGAAGLMDLRLLGFLKRVALPAAMQLRWFAAAGIVLNVVTGTLFFIGAADQYISNPAWWAKVFFLVVAMVNVAIFELLQGKRTSTVRSGDDTPVSFKVAGAVSILAWGMVLYFGRMLPFIGTAF